MKKHETVQGEPSNLRERIREAGLTPPPALKERVMAAVRAERRRRIRRIGEMAAVAAAFLLLLPAVTLLLPRLNESMPLVDSAAGTDAATPTDIVITGDTSGQSEDLPRDDGTAEPDVYAPPPAYVGKNEETTTPAGTVIPQSSDTVATEESDGPTETRPEPAWFDTLRRLVGEDAFFAYLAQYTGDVYAEGAEAEAYAYFQLDM